MTPALVDACARELRDRWASPLPEGWRVVYGPRAMSDLEGGVVLNVGVDGPRGEHAGARVHAGSVRAASMGHARLAAELVGELADTLRRVLGGDR